MTEGTITLERRGHLLLMGIDRQKKYNAFDLKMFNELALAFGQLQRDPEMRCGVVFAHGEHFTAGLELTQFAPAMASGKIPLPDGAIDPFGLEGEHLTKPVIIAVQGICFTIGLELLLNCDIRIAAQDVRFSQLEIKRGIYPVGGATIRLLREVGWGNAMRYLLTGDEFGAEEAYRMGLIQEVVEPGQQLDRAIQLAEVVAAQAPLGVQATIISARRSILEGETAAAQTLLPDLMPIMQSEDAQEGVMSFVERRQAVFKGR